MVEIVVMLEVVVMVEVVVMFSTLLAVMRFKHFHVLMDHLYNLR